VTLDSIVKAHVVDLQHTIYVDYVMVMEVMLDVMVYASVNWILIHVASVMEMVFHVRMDIATMAPFPIALVYVEEVLRLISVIFVMDGICY
jgi:hypothetical protein